MVILLVPLLLVGCIEFDTVSDDEESKVNMTASYSDPGYGKNIQFNITSWVDENYNIKDITIEENYDNNRTSVSTFPKEQQLSSVGFFMSEPRDRWQYSDTDQNGWINEGDQFHTSTVRYDDDNPYLISGLLEVRFKFNDKIIYEITINVPNEVV